MSYPQVERYPIQYKKLKYLATCNDDALSDSTDPEMVIEYVDIGSVDRVSGIQNAETYTFKDAPSRARRLAQCGDIVISTVRTYLEAIAPVDERHSKAVFSTGFAVVRPREIHAEFAKYALRSREFISSVIIESVGVGYPAISSRSLMNLKVPVPNQADQQVITRFLDKEVSRIDALVEEKRAFINLLKEKRQALISHVVTKGLYLDVEMKDSGVEWIGEIPEHWSCLKYKHVFKIKKNIAGNLGHDVLSITQKGIKIKDIDSGEGQLASDYSKYQIVNKGDFAMNHMDLLTGFVDLSRFNGVTSPDYRVFELIRKDYDPKFFLFLLQMGYLNKLFYPYGQGAAHVGRWRLPASAFRDFYAPCPPPEEQRKISDYLEKEIARYLDLIDEVNKSIQLLKEHRSALISAAVTGKIDLRDKEVA